MEITVKPKFDVGDKFIVSNFSRYVVVIEKLYYTERGFYYEFDLPISIFDCCVASEEFVSGDCFVKIIKEKE